MKPTATAPSPPPAPPAAGGDLLADIRERLTAVEAALGQLLRLRTVRDWYSTAEVAALLGKAEFTVREWCRLRRVRAEKRASGRGPHAAWVVSHRELDRLQREGLLPAP